MPVDANPDVAALGKNSEAAGLAADVQPANYLNLSVRVNGQPLALAGHGRARFNGKDVTRQLLDAAVPLLAGPDGDPWRTLQPPMRARLEPIGLRTGDGTWSCKARFLWNKSLHHAEHELNRILGG